jgi:hypothetical protein
LSASETQNVCSAPDPNAQQLVSPDWSFAQSAAARHGFTLTFAGHDWAKLVVHVSVHDEYAVVSGQLGSVPAPSSMSAQQYSLCCARH